MEITIKSHDFHRNGIGGTPFYVVLFSWKDGDGSGENFLAHIFPAKDEILCAVTDLDKASNGDIGFGSNSWRGDVFEKAILRELPPEITTNLGRTF